MQAPNLDLTKEDFANLSSILDSVEIKGRKSAEYIAILGMKLDLRVKNWFDKHPSGFDIIAVAKTSEAFEAAVKDAAIKMRVKEAFATAKPVYIAAAPPLPYQYPEARNTALDDISNAAEGVF